ncbi:MAG: OmpA family protein [Sulfuricurvum sp.]|nr:OmpA family protein [Sulfuricurvum sp.]
MEPFLISVGVILLLPFLASNPKTTVILLDNNLTKSAVDVTTDAGKVSIEEPYYLTKLVAKSEKPLSVEKGDEAAILEKYKDTLNALPSKPVSTLFYFEQGTADLTQSSKDQVDALMQLIVSREQPVAIDIIGHSDRAGAADKNYELALERANAVKSFLAEQHVTMEHLSVTSSGENDPIIVTEDGVSEPKNRRVEVIVR